MMRAAVRLPRRGAAWHSTAAARSTILYTHTDESPMVATYALLPIVRRFLAPAGITVETVDISIPSRILAQFPECLKPEQRVKDTLSELGQVVKTPEANIIKLPNVSASVPQLVRGLFFSRHAAARRPPPLSSAHRSRPLCPPPPPPPPPPPSALFLPQPSPFTPGAARRHL